MCRTINESQRFGKDPLTHLPRYLRSLKAEAVCRTSDKTAEEVIGEVVKCSGTSWRLKDIENRRTRGGKIWGFTAVTGRNRWRDDCARNDRGNRTYHVEARWQKVNRHRM